jgi:hypothetical protein
MPVQLPPATWTPVCVCAGAADPLKRHGATTVQEHLARDACVVAEVGAAIDRIVESRRKSKRGHRRLRQIQFPHTEGLEARPWVEPDEVRFCIGVEIAYCNDLGSWIGCHELPPTEMLKSLAASLLAASAWIGQANNW